MSTRPPAVVLLGPSALPAAQKLHAFFPGAELHGPRAKLPQGVVERPFEDPGSRLQELFTDGRAILALCAAGIVIRTLAPLLQDKRSEPPVVAVAEDGSVAVPLLGGHRGANELARAAARALGGHAAITTAGDLRLGVALDEPPPGWTLRNPDAAKPIMAAMLRGEAVGLKVEAGDACWLTASRARFAPDGAATVLLTERDVAGDDRTLVLHPRVLALGVGCERGTAAAELRGLVEDTLVRHGLARGALACIASLEVKSDEPALHTLAAELDLPARFFSAAELEAEAPRLANPSARVFASVGCHGVAEGAALAAAGPDGALIVAKTRSRRATCAIARAPASIDPERVGRPRGQLAIVGLGPGDPAWRTREADAALARAQDLVGYRGYLDLLGPVFGQRRHAFELGKEEARCRTALELAASGRQVALVSSGDPGIYAMAALVMELLERADTPEWQRIALTVCPGLSALQAAAARAGAPLGHDFCAVSLSDLVTPWSEIERRIAAAAAGDFVTIFFNPASRRRRQGLVNALAILARARPPGTPVIHARNLGRAGETVATVPLDTFDPCGVDMLSLVIVGSSRTRMVPRAHGAPFVYTPRGYFDEAPDAR